MSDTTTSFLVTPNLEVLFNSDPVLGIDDETGEPASFFPMPEELRPQLSRILDLKKQLEAAEEAFRLEARDLGVMCL